MFFHVRHVKEPVSVYARKARRKALSHVGLFGLNTLANIEQEKLAMEASGDGGFTPVTNGRTPSESEWALRLCRRNGRAGGYRN